MWFFRIERTDPPGGGPARVKSSRSLSTSLTLPALCQLAFCVLIPRSMHGKHDSAFNAWQIPRSMHSRSEEIYVFLSIFHHFTVFASNLSHCRTSTIILVFTPQPEIQPSSKIKKDDLLKFYFLYLSATHSESYKFRAL